MPRQARAALPDPPRGRRDYRRHTHPVVLPTAGYCVWAFGEIQTHSHGSHEGRGGYAVTARTDHGRFCS